MQRKATAGQVEMLRHYAGLPNPPQRAIRRNYSPSIKVCDERGWLQDAEEWPYRKITADGIEALRRAGGATEREIAVIDI